MPYLGNELATQFQAFVTQTITGDGSTGYTLDRAVANGKELLVYINNVKQEEGSGKSYTASGTTITFSEAVASGDSCYVVFLGSAVQTVVPPDASIVSGMIANANLEMPNTLDMNGKELILDADADTSITADTDDQIDFKVGGNDTHVFDANGHITLKQFLDDATAGGVITSASNRGDVARIRLFQSASGSDGGEIRFDIANTSNNMTERMRIDKAGTLLLNRTTKTLNCRAQIKYNGGSEQGIILENENNSAAGAAIRFIDTDGDFSGGGIYFTDSNSINYQTTSDYRLKENIISDWDATTDLKKLKPSKFNFKKTPTKTVQGFIAHEVSDVVPEAIIGVKDGTEKYIDDEDGKEKTRNAYQSIDQSKLVPLLTKALQEAVAKIETLEAKVTALEGK